MPLARVACDFLTMLSGFFVQMQRQRSHFVKARHLFFLPSLGMQHTLGHKRSVTGQWQIESKRARYHRIN
jgi:hypothetical protein